MTHRTHGTYVTGSNAIANVRRCFVVTLETGTRSTDPDYTVTIDLIDPDSGLVLYSTPANPTRFEGKHAYRRAIRWADYHGIPVVFSHLGNGEPIPGM